MNSMKKVLVWLLATSLVFAAVAVLIPKQTIAAIAAQVFVANFPAVQMTRDKDNPALTPFQTVLCAKAGSISCGSSSDRFPVPGGQRAVIEYISSGCQASGGFTIPLEWVITTVGGSSDGQYFLPVGPPDGSGHSLLNQQTRIYADPGTFIILATEFVGNGINPGSSAICSVTLSGYLVTP